jgi:micrococcal nuclease
MKKLMKTTYVCAFGRLTGPLVAVTGAPAVRRLLSVLVVLLALPSGAWAQLVTRVVDGDTIVVAGVGTVRLIGVDTPETVDPRTPVQSFGKEASEFTGRMAQGKVVRLEFDVQRKDKYERTLSYAYLPDGTFLNAEIVKQGFGHAYTTYPFRYLEQFKQFEREARAAKRGLWATGQTAPVPLASPVAAATTDTVYVTKTGQKYHRAGCRSLARSQIPMPLAEAAARYGACGICKPPTLSAPAAPSPVASAPQTVAQPASVSAGRCQATTKRGTQCSRQAQPGRHYCWQH